MGVERQKIQQLELAFTTGPRGEASEPVVQGDETSIAKRKTERPAQTEQLMEEVCERGNLKKALKRVQDNKGAPGIDGMTVDGLAEHLRQHWPNIRESLLTGTYKPTPVRRVEIPKPGSTEPRKIGIPTSLDRFIQQAVLQVLQKRFDPGFSDHSYGFRPGRSAHQAVARAQQYVRQGFTIVVDLDLSKFYDRINQDRLMSRLAQTVGDKQMLKLIRAFLNAGVMEEGLVKPTLEGAPQGGPLSPLLSNVVLDELDRELERRGHRFVRYADDLQVYVRSQRAGERVMTGLRRFVTSRLKLKVNEHKSAVAPVWKRKFLGFRFAISEHRKRCIAQPAINRFRQRTREITGRSRGISLAQVVCELTKYIRGWIGYFGFCEARYVLRDLDSWIRRRLRCFIWKKWKTFKRRRRGLMERGIAEAAASQTAARSRGCWSTSRVPPLRMAFPNAYFDALGLLRMFVR